MNGIKPHKHVSLFTLRLIILNILHILVNPWPWYMLMMVKCPICKKKNEWEGNPYRPFCSERCKNVDLAAWASDEYRIAGDKKGGVEGEDEEESD